MPRSLLFLAILLGQCVGCDRLHDPVILNATEDRVDIQVVFVDGSSSSLSLGPDDLVHVGHPPQPPRTVTISSPEGNAISRLEAADYPRLLGRPAAGDPIGWKISSDGVMLLTESDLDAHRRAGAAP
jgi:hypothetical protein